MDIKASDVKTLREKTGAGMMECKNALVATKGDFAEAEKILKEKGLAAVEKRVGRATTEGLILVKADKDRAVIAEITCETDFVSKNVDFIALGEKVIETAFEKKYTEITSDLSEMVLELATKVRENMSLTRLEAVTAGDDEYISYYIHSDKKTGALVVLKADKASLFDNKDVQGFAYDCCLHLAAFTPRFKDAACVEQKYIEEQTEIFTKQVEELDKPEAVKTGIITGKLKKHLAEICFLEQPFVKDDKMTVAKKMEAVGKAAGGTLTLSKMVLFQLGAE
ncbi:MAG TPA: translation elongation factor Ts [Treponema sp.]|nr:translation elongation factor Ts [Treponema sp.]